MSSSNDKTIVPYKECKYNDVIMLSGKFTNLLTAPCSKSSLTITYPSNSSTPYYSRILLNDRGDSIVHTLLSYITNSDGLSKSHYDSSKMNLNVTSNGSSITKGSKLDDAITKQKKANMLMVDLHKIRDSSSQLLFGLNNTTITNDHVKQTCSALDNFFHQIITSSEVNDDVIKLWKSIFVDANDRIYQHYLNTLTLPSMIDYLNRKGVNNINPACTYLASVKKGTEVFPYSGTYDNSTPTKWFQKGTKISLTQLHDANKIKYYSSAYTSVPLGENRSLADLSKKVIDVSTTSYTLPNGFEHNIEITNEYIDMLSNVGEVKVSSSKPGTDRENITNPYQAWIPAEKVTRSVTVCTKEDQRLGKNCSWQNTTTCVDGIEEFQLYRLDDRYANRDPRTLKGNKQLDGGSRRLAKNGGVLPAGEKSNRDTWRVTCFGHSARNLPCHKPISVPNEERHDYGEPEGISVTKSVTNYVGRAGKQGSSPTHQDAQCYYNIDKDLIYITTNTLDKWIECITSKAAVKFIVNSLREYIANHPELTYLHRFNNVYGNDYRNVLLKLNKNVIAVSSPLGPFGVYTPGSMVEYNLYASEYTVENLEGTGIVRKLRSHPSNNYLDKVFDSLLTKLHHIECDNITDVRIAAEIPTLASDLDVITRDDSTMDELVRVLDEYDEPEKPSIVITFKSISSLGSSTVKYLTDTDVILFSTVKSTNGDITTTIKPIKSYIYITSPSEYLNNFTYKACSEDNLKWVEVTYSHSSSLDLPQFLTPVHMNPFRIK